MPHRSSPPAFWRKHLTIGVLLPRGRFAWWYCLSSLFVLVGGLFLASQLPHMGQDLEHAVASSLFAIFAVGAVFIAAALAPPLLATQRVYAQDFPAPKGLLVWRMGVVLAVTLLIQLMVTAFEAFVPGAREASETVARSLNLGQNLWFDACMVLAIAVLAPLSEEWLFRGLFFRSLRDGLARWMPLWLSSAIGIALSSLLFALMHVGEGQIAQWPILFLMGILLALTYEWTGSLLAAMLIHALNNAIALFSIASLPDLALSSEWILPLAACSPLILLGLGCWLLRILPSAPPASTPTQTMEPPPLPQPMRVADGQSSAPKPPPGANR